MRLAKLKRVDKSCLSCSALIRLLRLPFPFPFPLPSFPPKSPFFPNRPKRPPSFPFPFPFPPVKPDNDPAAVANPAPASPAAPRPRSEVMEDKSNLSSSSLVKTTLARQNKKLKQIAEVFMVESSQQLL